jgi:hypothetical protein
MKSTFVCAFGKTEERKYILSLEKVGSYNFFHPRVDHRNCYVFLKRPLLDIDCDISSVMNQLFLQTFTDVPFGNDLGGMAVTYFITISPRLPR